MAAKAETQVERSLHALTYTDLKSTSDSEVPQKATAIQVVEQDVPESPEKKLLVSPYSEDDHLLNLSSVSVPCQLLARALTEMQAVRTDYATAEYTEAFNWSVVYDKLQVLVRESDSDWPAQCFYIVVFRSQIPPTTSRAHLGGLDERSHAEATETGGLLKYWFGEPDDNGRNLATCIWRDVRDAKKGGSGPGHRQAAKETRALYTEWRIERLRLSVGEGAKSWEISEWES